MCAKLLACPLCSQPAFFTLSALRTGLINVATRPLTCPVCNEVLLGIDKLTIHLFSHAINLSNDARAIADRTKLDNDNSPTEGYETVGNEQIIPVQTWNIINEQSPIAKQSFTQGDSMKYETQTISEIAMTPLCKITNSRSTLSTKNETMNTISQTCFEHNNQTENSTLSTITEHDGTLMQSLEQLQEISDRNMNSIISAEIYLQNIPKECQSRVENSQQVSLRFKEIDLACKTDEKQLRLDCAGNLSKQSTDFTKEEYTNSVLQVQPIWRKNSQQKICVQNILVGSNNLVTAQAGHQIFTILPKTAPENADVLLNPQEDNEKNNITGKRTNASDNRQCDPDQSQILPQLKAFKTLTTKEKTKRCDICGFYFSDTNILTLHKQLVHMINEKDVNTKAEDLLKNYRCHLCPKVFKMRGSLMVHMRVAHIGYNLGSLLKEGDPLPMPGKHGYNCPTCGKNFKKEQHVTQHLKTHEGKQWECDICSKLFTTKYFLKKHKRLHSGEMPYKCNICDKTFTFQQSYHKHRLYHKDDKPHACTTCGRSFKELSTLHNHERIHTGEKPFACETCGKCFRQRVSYLVHRRIHTGAMPYKCTACGKSFRYKVSQRTHKCSAQPPGTVVRQSSDLVQRLLQVSQRRDSDTKVRNDTALHQDHGCLPNEDNRYILIINDQGQHVLTRQSEVENKTVRSSVEEEHTLEVNKYDNQRSEETFIESLWGHNISSATTLKAAMEMSVKNTSVEELARKSDTNKDFFSMVLTTVENEIPSPSNEMEHLRLSSPPSNEDLLEIKKNDLVQSVTNFQCGTSETMIQQNCRADSSTGAAPLPTINEESLKQLLYGTETSQS